MAYFSIPRSWLVGEWLLDWNPNDTNDGTKSNTTATSVPYENSKSNYQKQIGVFNGSSSRVSATSSSSYNFSGTGGFTIVAAVETTWSVSGDHSIVHREDGISDFWGYNLQLAGSNLIFRIRSDSNTSASAIVSATGLTWKLILLTARYDGSTIKIFNGMTEIASTNSNLSVGWTSLNLGIWAHSEGFPAYLAAKIWVVRLYNRPISTLEQSILVHEFNRTLAGGSDPLSWIVAYYDFQGDANDVVGQNNGTVSWAALTTDYFGIANSAYDFDGVNDIISAGGVALTTAYTVFWRIKIDTVGTGAAESYIFRLHQSGTSILHFMTYQDKWYVYHSGGAKVIQPSSPAPATGQYYNFAITYDGSTVTLYIDGVSIGTATSATTLGANNTLDIGGKAGVGFFDGKIDFISFIPQTRTADEIKALHDLTKIRYVYPFRKSIPRTVSTGIVFGASNFDGTNLRDWSGNANGGTVTQGTYSSYRFGQNVLRYQSNHTTQNLSLGTGASFKPTSAFTFITTIIPTSTSYTGSPRLFTNEWGTNGGIGVGLGRASATDMFPWVRLNYNNGSTPTTTRAVPTNKPTRYGVTYDGSTVKIYLNGKLEASASYSATILYDAGVTTYLSRGINTGGLIGYQGAEIFDDRAFTLEEMQHDFHAHFA